MIVCINTCFAQVGSHEMGTAADCASQVFIATDSLLLIKGTCKNMYGFAIIKEEKRKKPLSSTVPIIVEVPEPPKHWIKINGNVLYNFNYRSYLDTPFVERDLIQQSVQTRFDVTIKEDYPLTVFLTNRTSNSSYFINATDVNIQFKKSTMLDGIKGRLKKEVDGQLGYKGLQLSPEQLYRSPKNGLGNLDELMEAEAKKSVKDFAKKDSSLMGKFLALYSDYKEKKDKMNALQQWVNSPSRLQELIEEKEKRVRDSLMDLMNKAKQPALAANQKTDPNSIFQSLDKKRYKGKIAVPEDSTDEASANSTKDKIKRADSSVSKNISGKQKELNELKKEVAAAENKLKLFQKRTKDSLQHLKQQIAAINNSQSLNAYLSKTGESQTQLPALQRALLSVNQIGIGRSWIDYSDLTVKNISLNGFNIEANPGNVYMAAAVGKVNYRFRDFIVKGDYAGSSQSLGLVRLGYGRKEGNNLIATYYAGQKALLNQTGNADSMAVKRVNGFSLESRMVVNANNYIIAEYARSSSIGNKGKMFDLSTHTNEAWAIKSFSDYPSTHTRVTAYYRKMGEGFQSFTLYPTNSNQEAWSFKLKQGFLKQKLLVEASVRKNDFNSPIASPDFSSSTVFKSFQASLRVRKYPLVTVGFYPSSQLSMSNNNVLYEQQFNILNAIVSHTYFIGETNMGSSLVYTKFYNKGKDSGFIYFNASSCIFNHSIYKGAFVYQTIITITKQTDIKQRTIEPIVTYQLKNKISITGSVKWSDVNNRQTLWGGMAGLNMFLKGIGTIQMQYDKSYLPGYNRNLIPVGLGRITFNREF